MTIAAAPISWGVSVLHDPTSAGLGALAGRARWFAAADADGSGRLLHGLDRAEAIARAGGLDLVLHPHVGTAIKSAAAVERVLHVHLKDVDLALGPLVQQRRISLAEAVEQDVQLDSDQTELPSIAEGLRFMQAYV